MPQYSLRASVSHHGKTLTVGHYTADVCQRDGSWLRFDDNAVYQVPLNKVLGEASTVYLLFYELQL